MKKDKNRNDIEIPFDPIFIVSLFPFIFHTEKTAFFLNRKKKTFMFSFFRTKENDKKVSLKTQIFHVKNEEN